LGKLVLDERTEPDEDKETLYFQSPPWFK